MGIRKALEQERKKDGGGPSIGGQRDRMGIGYSDTGYASILFEVLMPDGA